MSASITIRIKLMGMLKDKSPADGTIEIEREANIADVLQLLDIPVDSVQVFTVNGTLEQNKSRALQDQDELTVLPPVGGG